jgi:hypothetical protein
MLQLLFWILFIVAYTGFALWVAKALLSAIFLAVSGRGSRPEPVPVATRRLNRRTQ